MNFAALHENLRLEILHRIDHGLLSGSTLARSTGFQQAHISNFLNRKRCLSLEGLDRVLASQDISILDLIPADLYVSKFAPSRSLKHTKTVPITTHRTAATAPRIDPTEILETIEVLESALDSSRERPASGRNLWQRFIAVRVDALQALAMDPLLRQNCVAVIDRHYNSLALYRAQGPAIYAVYVSDGLHLCFLEQDGNRLILRPRDHKLPIRILELPPNQQASERIVGRVCYVLAEI
jgi:hypothetical protein